MEKQWRGHFFKNSSVICEDEKMITATSRNTIKEANKNRLFHRPVIKEKEMSSNSTPFLIFTHWLPHVEIVSLHHHPPWTTWEINSFEDSSLPRIKEKVERAHRVRLTWPGKPARAAHQPGPTTPVYHYHVHWWRPDLDVPNVGESIF